MGLEIISLALAIVAVLLSFLALNLGLWSLLVGAVVLILCLLTIFLLHRRLERGATPRATIIDEEGFQRKERVLNRTARKPATGPLWRSRIYPLGRGDQLKMELISDQDVIAQLMIIEPGGERDVGGAYGPLRRLSEVFEAPEEGGYCMVVSSDQPRVVLTIRIGYRPRS